MTVIPAGSFRMGDIQGKGDDDGKPVHRVTISRPFSVGKYEVTWSEWDACVAAGSCDNGPVAGAGGDEGWGTGNRPVFNVSWNDTQAYVKWLSGKTGEDYHLLSESEWEYVARAGTTGQFWWGPSITTDQANYDGNSTYGDGPIGKYRKKTVPVDSFAANAFGLYNVHGNVWEWVEDCYKGSYTGAPTDGKARTTDSCDNRVARGGSWVNYPLFLRSADRNGITPGFLRYRLGFRVAR